MNTGQSLCGGVQPDIDDADEVSMTHVVTDTGQVAPIESAALGDPVVSRDAAAPSQADERIERRSADPGLRRVIGLATVLMGLLPFHLYFPVSGTGNPMADPVLALQDLLIAPIGLLGVAWIVRHRRSVSPVTLALLFFWATVAAAAVVHPSLRGSFHVVRLLSLPVFVELCTRREVRHRLTVVLVASTAFSAVVALGQRLRQGPLGLGMIGERDDPFLSLVPGFPTPQAFTGHPYHAGTMFAGAMAAICVAGLHQKRMDRRWLAPVAVLAFATAQCSSRMLIVVLVAMCLVLSMVGVVRRDARRSAFLLAASIVVPTALWVGAQAGSYERPSAESGQTFESLANGRGALISQAVDIWKSAPLLGVGPGNYVAAQRDLGLRQVGDWPIVVHSYPLQVLSESGLIGVAGLIGACVALVWAVRRRWSVALVVAVVVAPTALLDHAMWTYGFATVVLGFLIGTALPVRETPLNP
jgi:hypothetical protein